MKVRFALLPMLAAVLSFAAQAADTVKYGLKISNAAQHLAEVSAEFPATAESTFVVQLPSGGPDATRCYR